VLHEFGIITGYFFEPIPSFPKAAFGCLPAAFFAGYVKIKNHPGDDHHSGNDDEIEKDVTHI